MVRRFGALLVALASLGVVAVSAAPAGAQCLGPMVRYDPAEAARGEKVLISGAYWGDDCYDDDRAPPGEGVLGAPIRKITISLKQGDRRIVVAKGAADRSYRFAVWVRVPTTLEPGGANVVATEHRAPGAGDVDHMTDELRITDAPARGSRNVKVVKFGKPGKEPHYDARRSGVDSRRGSSITGAGVGPWSSASQPQASHTPSW
jgi:hypothetical protein